MRKVGTTSWIYSLDNSRLLPGSDVTKNKESLRKQAMHHMGVLRESTTLNPLHDPTASDLSLL